MSRPIHHYQFIIHNLPLNPSAPPYLVFERTEHALDTVLDVPDATGHNIPNPMLRVKHDEVGVGTERDFPLVLQS